MSQATPIHHFFDLIVKQGIAIPSRYSLNIGLPAGIQSFLTSQSVDPKAASQRLSIACRTTQFPSKYMEVDSQKIAGVTRNFPNEQSYDNTITLNFRISEDHYEKLLFEKWMDLIIDPVTRKVGYYNDYIATLTVIQLDRAGNPLYSAKMTEVFPTDIFDHSANTDIENDYQRFTVTLAFSTYKSTTPTINPNYAIAQSATAPTNVNTNSSSAGNTQVLLDDDSSGTINISNKIKVAADSTSNLPGNATKLMSIGGKIVPVLFNK